MIRTAKFIFCDNEQWTGDVTYPDILGSVEVLRQHFIDSPTLAQLRKDVEEAACGAITKIARLLPDVHGTGREFIGTPTTTTALVPVANLAAVPSTPDST